MLHLHIMQQRDHSTVPVNKNDSTAETHTWISSQLHNCYLDSNQTHTMQLVLQQKCLPLYYSLQALNIHCFSFRDIIKGKQKRPYN